MIAPLARVTLATVRFGLHTGAPILDLVELHALCVLAVIRADSSTGKMLLGQARAKAGRICRARAAIVTARMAETRQPLLLEAHA